MKELKSFLKFQFRDSFNREASWEFFRRKWRERRAFRANPYGQAYYPPEIAAVFAPSPIPEVSPSPVDPENLSRHAPRDLWLASEKVPLFKDNLDIEWDVVFADPEDEESLHRWNWLLQLASRAVVPTAGETDWALRQIRRWRRKYDHELTEPAFGTGRWESYSVGERIANVTVFFERIKTPVPDDIASLLVAFAAILAGRLEYKGDLTGNHVVNNARGLFLGGDARWTELAKKIFTRELPKLVVDDFLREGSSHYQFLFTRWILEVQYFARKRGDGEFAQFLAVYADRLKRGCRFFLVARGNGWGIPLIGDISPDFRPGWLIDVPFWGDPASKLPTKSWNHLLSPVGESKSQIAEDSAAAGWYRIDSDRHVAILRVEPESHPQHVGHHHADLLHFCYFFDGEPLLVDSGRTSYSPTEWGNYGVKAEAHNTFLIDGLPAVPERWRRFPERYFAARNQVFRERGAPSLDIATTAFSRIDKHLTVRRRLNFEANRLIVKDSFAGHGGHRVTTYFQFPPGVVLHELNGHEISIESETIEGHLRCSVPLRALNIHVGVPESPVGWMATEYGKAAIGVRLEFTAELAFPGEITYEFTLGT